MEKFIAHLQTVFTEIGIRIHVDLFQRFIQSVGNMHAVFQIAVPAERPGTHPVCYDTFSGDIYIFGLCEDRLADQADPYDEILFSMAGAAFPGPVSLDRSHRTVLFHSDLIMADGIHPSCLHGKMLFPVIEQPHRAAGCFARAEAYRMISPWLEKCLEP